MNCPRCQNLIRDGELFCGNCGLPAESLETTQIMPVGTADLTQPIDPLVGQVLDAKYELLERLGQGGMGAVYKARRRHIGDEVAIKILLEKYLEGREATERFRREARAAAMLRHPNVVIIHDFSDGAGADAPAYIVMELVDGVSLRARLKREGRIPFENAVSLMQGVCAGVGSAHRRGIIHRDLKPDNIIIAAAVNPGGSETVKVIDFGIAKLREADGGPSLTQTGILIGTPFYMSPEQCLGEPLDPRSDVYSLGAILYEMLGGFPPFTGNTPTAVVAKHLTDTAVPLDQLGVAPALAEICRRALAKDPAQRYQSVEDLYDDLKRAAESIRPGIVVQNRGLQSAQSATTLTSLPADQTTLVQAPGFGPILQVPERTQPVPGLTQQADLQPGPTAKLVPAGTANRLRRMRWFALGGGLVLLALSIGVGFLLRWLGWLEVSLAYDEFALVLITVGLRDAIFGVFLGITLAALRRRRAGELAQSNWIASLITYASCGAAIAMLPFVILRTSLFLIPLGLAMTGAVVGSIICGVRMLLQRFTESRPAP